MPAPKAEPRQPQKWQEKIKENYKQKFWGEKRYTWIPDAISELDKWVQNNWKENKKPDLGFVLVKCNKKTLARVQPGMENKYDYKDDKTPTFGIGKRQEALTFFFCSRGTSKALAPTMIQDFLKSLLTPLLLI